LEVIVAESSGFCYGVKRALDTVAKSAKTSCRRMFTLGPLIHNPQVIQKLEVEGIESVADLSEVPAGSLVVMPTHGAPARVMAQAQKLGLEIVDVTCPFVRKVHRLAESLVRQGYQVVILGDEGHTEVQGIISRAGNDAVAVSCAEDLKKSPLKRRVGILAQTTQSLERYQQLVAAACECAYEVRAYNTICSATVQRQKAALAVAQGVDVMLVVGGRNSANTRRLAEICAETGVSTYHVEVADEIDADWFARAKKAGLTAGASTPDWIIKEVIRKVKEIPAAV